MGPVLPIGFYPKSIVYSLGNIRGQMAIHGSDTISRMPTYHLNYHKNLGLSCSSIYTWKQRSLLSINCFRVQRGHVTPYSTQCSACFSSLTLRSLVGSRCHQLICSSLINRYKKMKLRLLVPKQYACNAAPFYGRQSNFVVAFFVVLFTFCSASQIAYAKAPKGFGKREFYCENSSSDYTHTKPLLKNYSIIGIPGDGRCLFRSVAHGACIRSGKPAPSQAHQMDLADNLRSKVADEFIKRRNETEWFIEGDFNTYVSNIRKPHVWGGEPELFMASHVLGMPITVYMYDQDAGGLISIAEYGQEYGKENPIRVLFHGYGHYDAIHIPSSSL